MSGTKTIDDIQKVLLGKLFFLISANMISHAISQLTTAIMQKGITKLSLFLSASKAATFASTRGPKIIIHRSV